MDTAGTGLQGDMVAENDDALAVIEGVLRLHELKLRALELGKAAKALEPGSPGDILCQFFGEDICLAVRRLCKDIGQFRVQTDGKISGNGPRGGCPYDKVSV